LLGLSERRVRELRDQGVIPGAERGQYVVGEAIRAYCAHMRPSSGRGADGGSEAAEGLDAARIRLLTAQAEAREMLNEQLRGEAVQTSDLEVVVGVLIDGVRAKMLALPSRAAPLLVSADGAVEIQKTLTELVHEACGDLAATEVVAAVSDRARRRASRNADGDEDTSEAGATS